MRILSKKNHIPKLAFLLSKYLNLHAWCFVLDGNFLQIFLLLRNTTKSLILRNALYQCRNILPYIYSQQDPLELRKRIIILRKNRKPVWWLPLHNFCKSSVQGYLSLKSNKYHYFLIVLMFRYKCSCFIVRSYSWFHYRYNSGKLQILRIKVLSRIIIWRCNVATKIYIIYNWICSLRKCKLFLFQGETLEII